MTKKSNFYTLKGYNIKNNSLLTESMEDYLEMIYRTYISNKRIRINELALLLNVKPSSATKMIDKLKTINLIEKEKYDDIYLTEEGKKKGNYLLWRHNTLVNFFKYINQNKYQLEQVEKIEHFIDYETLVNIEKILKKNSI